VKRDLIPAALILAAGIAAFGLAVHRLPAEMAYAANLADQRPPLPQVMPGTFSWGWQSRFLPQPGTKYARQPSGNAGQDVGSTPTASTIYGGAPDSTDGATRGSRRTARPQQGKPHNRQSGGNASGGLNAVSAGGATAFLRASMPGARPGTFMPGLASAGRIWSNRADNGPLDPGTSSAMRAESQRPTSGASKHPVGALAHEKGER
jgi:hypothetical protein